MPNSIISVENLSKSYKLGQRELSNLTFREMLIQKVSNPFDRSGKRPPNEPFWALKDVSFEMQQGEVLGIVGRNGAGKSTLLKILSRIVEPTAGKARLRGRVASLLEVGTGFHPELTGRENVYLNGAILGMRKTELNKKFDEIVEFSGVEKFLDTPVKRYSSGMYVRLAFAVAAHLEPDILIVDEVLAVGDAQFQEKCIGKMKEVGKAEGRTVLFVSHNMPAVRSLCKTAILLDAGKVLVSGDANYVVNQYCHAGIIESKHEKRWSLEEAPGNARAKLTRIALHGQKTPESGTAELEEPIMVTIEYEVLSPGIRLNTSIELFDEQDTTVFSSPSMSDTRWYGQAHPTGKFITQCQIPGHFLNSGHYYVTPMLVEDQGHAIGVANKPVSIEMIDTGAERQKYFGRWVGATRPSLKWTTLHQESTENILSNSVANK